MEEIKIKCEDFKEALELVRPGLAKKEIVEQMVHFIFDQDMITTFNDMVCIMHPFTTNLQCSVKADELYKWVSRKTGELGVTKLDDGGIVFRAGSGRLQMSTQVEDLLSEALHNLRNEIPIQNEQWYEVPDSFLEGIVLCSFSASTDEVAGPLTCIQVRDNLLTATDRVRLARFEMDSFMTEEGDEVLMKAVIAKDLASFKPVLFSWSSSWVFFKNKIGTIFSVRKMKGSFLACDELLQRIMADVVTEPIELKSEDVINAVDTVTVLKEGDEFIQMNFREGNIRFEYKSQIGRAVEVISHPTPSNSGFSINVSPDFIRNALSKGATRVSVAPTREVLIMERNGFQQCICLFSSKMNDTTEDDIPF